MTTELKILETLLNQINEAINERIIRDNGILFEQYHVDYYKPIRVIPSTKVMVIKIKPYEWKSTLV